MVSVSHDGFKVVSGVHPVASLVTGKQMENSRTKIRCPSYRGVHLMEFSVLWRCPSYGGVHLMEVSVLWRCPSYGGVPLMEVSLFWRCPS